MSGFEQLIRDTLAKQAEPTHAVRQRVYDSARSALERMIANRPGLAEQASGQRDALEAAIARVEAEHAAPAISPTAPPTASNYAPPPASAYAPPHVSSEQPRPPATHAPSPTPDVGLVDPVVDRTPRASASSKRSRRGDRAGVRGDRRRAREAERLLDEKPKRSWVLVLLWIIMLAGLATAGWWGWTYGRPLIESELSRLSQTGPASPPPVVEEEGWLTLFEPTRDIASVTSQSGTEIVRDTQGAFLRITSPSGSAVSVALPAGALQALRGRRTTVEMRVRGVESDANDQDDSHFFAVACDFGDEAGCGRKRFQASPTPLSFIFDIDLTEGGDNGTLVFTPDMGGNRAIDVGRIRARVAG